MRAAAVHCGMILGGQNRLEADTLVCDAPGC
jgi:hypothetical protein